MTEFFVIVSIAAILIMNVVILFFGYHIFKKYDAIDKIHNLVCYNNSTVEKNNKILSKYEQLINEEIENMVD